MELVGIGFDLDHTLAIDNRLERVAFLRLLDTLLDEGARTIGTLSDEVDGIDRLLARQRDGEFSIDEAVRRFVSEHGLTPGERHVRSFRTDSVEMVGAFVIPLPGAKQTLRALHERGCALAVLSNGWNPLQQRKAERAGFAGPVLVSAEIGALKPAPEAFETLLRALGTPPRRTWYVGDDPGCDVAGAHAVGLGTVWFNWEQKAYPRDLPAPGRTIGALEELLDIVPEPVRS